MFKTSNFVLFVNKFDVVEGNVLSEYTNTQTSIKFEIV